MNTLHDESPERAALALALRRELTRVEPDLDHLVAVATRQGTRIRRTRRALGTLGALGAGGLAAAAVATFALSGADRPAAPLQPASVPSPSVTTQLEDTCEIRRPANGDQTNSRDVRSTVEDLDKAEAAARAGEKPGLVHCLRVIGGPAPTPVKATLPLAGWACEPVVDEKTTCRADDAAVHVVWRAAAGRAAWIADPDKVADHVSGVRSGLFVTVDAVEGTPAAVAGTVGRALRWTTG